MSDPVEPIHNPYQGLWDYQYDANTCVPFCTDEHPNPEKEADFNERGIVHIIAPPQIEYWKYFVSNGALIPLNTMNVVVSKATIKDDGVDEATISNIPADAHMTIDGVDHTAGIANGTFTLSANEEGVYAVAITAKTYLPTLLKVTAQ